MSDYQNMLDTELSSDLDDRLSAIAALGDVLGSVRADELADDSIGQLGALVRRLANDANALGAELWGRLRAAKVADGDCLQLDDG
ncbi:MAG: hypothetical protein KC425_10555 [Anaerolineales bacterium]|nr:hypothetical protein [Anaerolineales bacterium]